MIRVVLRRHLLVSIFPLNFFNNDQVVTTTTKEPSEPVPQQESGWNRVVQMFSKDDFGRLSAELNSIIQVACLSTVVGLGYGGIVYSKGAYQDFIKRNQATAFVDHFEAKKKLQDAVSLSFAKGAFKWAWRLTLFTTMYMTVTTTIAAYRGKNGIMEHAIGGAFAGTMYKLKLGPAAWLVGGGIGCLLGGFAGLMTYSLLKVSGLTMDEVRYWNYKWVEERSRAYNKEAKLQVETEEIKLLLEHSVRPENILDINSLENKVNNEKK